MGTRKTGKVKAHIAREIREKALKKSKKGYIRSKIVPGSGTASRS
jgi:hypothetical protein